MPRCARTTRSLRGAGAPARKSSTLKIAKRPKASLRLRRMSRPAPPPIRSHRSRRRSTRRFESNRALWVRVDRRSGTTRWEFLPGLREFPEKKQYPPRFARRYCFFGVNSVNSRAQVGRRNCGYRHSAPRGDSAFSGLVSGASPRQLGKRCGASVRGGIFPHKPMPRTSEVEMPGIEPGSEMRRPHMTTSVSVGFCLAPHTHDSKLSRDASSFSWLISRRLPAYEPLRNVRWHYDAAPDPHQREGSDDATTSVVLFSYRLRGNRNSIPVDLRTYVLCTF